MKKFFAIILLIGATAINIGTFCQSLCLIGHDNMVHHTSNTAMQKQKAQTDVCSITRLSNHSNHHQSDHTAAKTLIKCDCSSHREASLDYKTILASAVDLTPYLQNISTLPPCKTIHICVEIIPVERPPKILA